MQGSAQSGEESEQPLGLAEYHGRGGSRGMGCCWGWERHRHKRTERSVIGCAVDEQRASGLISQDMEGNSIAEQNNTHMETVS